MPSKPIVTAPFAVVLTTLLSIAIGGCLYVFEDLETREIGPAEIPGRVDSPVKAHLMNGYVGVMPQGFVLQDDMLVPQDSFRLYDLRLEPVQYSGGISVDSILALESYEEEVMAGQTLLVSAVATGGAMLAGSGLAVAIFGSCPTIYDIDGENETLESEAFSYSIASLFETKDFDRIHVTPDERGVVHLDLRNEALETHYINQIELLRISHDKRERAYPDGTGQAMIVSGERPPIVTKASDGSSALESVTSADGSVFSTPTTRLKEAGPGNTSDHLDLTWSAPESDSAVVVLKLRNSLLNTILFYDFMIANQGVSSLDWMHSHVNSIDAALEMGQFFRTHLGLRVKVMGPGGYQPVGRIGGVGPIAWEEVAIDVPVLQRDSVRIRLEYLADAWRIDRVAMGNLERVETPERIPVSRVTDAESNEREDVRLQLTDSDEEYLITGPGTAYMLEFDSSPVADSDASWFMAAQGYYTEWVRGSWIQQNERPEPLVLSEATLVRVLEEWRERKPEFEEQFYSTKIPVR